MIDLVRNRSVPIHFVRSINPFYAFNQILPGPAKYYCFENCSFPILLLSASVFIQISLFKKLKVKSLRVVRVFRMSCAGRVRSMFVFILFCFLNKLSSSRNTYVVKVKNQLSPRPITTSDQPSTIQKKKSGGNSLSPLNNDGIYMTGVNGQRFHCFLPTAEERKLAEAGDVGAGGSKKVDPMVTIKAIKTILENSRKSTPCYQVRQGYWSYEVCPFVGVRQYPSQKNAVDKKPSERGSTNHIGAYEESMDAIDGDGTYIQSFTNGLDGRRAELRVVCAPGINAATPLSVNEPEKMHYVFTLESPLVCGELDSSPREMSLSEQAKHALRTLENVCVRYVEAWWTYELCNGIKVTQFHVEAATQKPSGTSTIAPTVAETEVTTEYMLGHFDSQVNQKLIREDVAVLSGPPQKRFKQVYNGGTKCDLTQKPRTVSVEFVCSDTETTYIMGIEEVSTCTYKMSVATPLLCEVPGFENINKMNSQSFENIICHLSDSSDEMSLN